MDLGAVDYGCECLELRSIPVMPICDPHKSLPEKILLKVYTLMVNVNTNVLHTKHIRNLATRSCVPRLHFRNSFFFGRDLRQNLSGNVTARHNVAHSQNSEYVISA